MLSDKKLRKVLAGIPLTSAGGLWARAVQHKYLVGPPPGAPPGSRPEPLWSKGSSLFGGRYTPKGGAPAIYLASDPNVALLETNAIFMPPKGPAVMAGAPPMVICQINVAVTNVLDLTDPAIVTSLGTSTAELTGDWRYDMGIGRVPPTHALAAAAHASGRVSAIRAHSAKAVGSGVVLVVVPDRLAKGSFLRVIDPSGTLVQEILGTL